MSALSPDEETTGAELAPRRMLDGGAGEHERNWLASARLDRVPSGAKARVAAALGGVLERQPAPDELEPAARGAAPLPSDARSSLGVLGVGLVSTGLVVALALSLPPQAPPAQSSPPASTPTASTPAASAPGAEARAAGSPEPLAQQAELATPRAPSGTDRSGPPRPKKKATAHAEPTGSGLLAEVRALEAVSASIGAAQLDRAVRELDAYRRRFGRGELAIEADVLAIQIAAARGDDAAANAGAERLLARPEAEHYRARVQALLEGEVPASSAAHRENAERARSNEPATHIRARR
jgi:hypothetical protein